MKTVIFSFVAALILTAAPVHAHPSQEDFVARAVAQADLPGDELTPALAQVLIDVEREATRRWKAIDARWDAAHAPEPVVVADTTGTAPAAPVAVSGTANWDAIVDCEASGNWGLVTTGNGYYFALQFAPSTWLGYGGTQAELDAGVAPSPSRLIQVAEAVLAGQGPGAWPNCFVWS